MAALIFGTAAGCYIRHEMKELAPSGGIQIENIVGSDGSVSGLVTVGFHERRQDSNYVQRCFGGANFVYGFGQNIAGMRIDALAMVSAVNPSGCLPTANFSTLERQYIANSLSEKGQIKVSFGAAGFAIKAYLINLEITTLNPVFNIHQCAFDFIILDPATGEKSSDAQLTSDNSSAATPASTSDTSGGVDQAYKQGLLNNIPSTINGGANFGPNNAASVAAYFTPRSGATASLGQDQAAAAFGANHQLTV